MVIAWGPRWEKKEKKIDERSEPRGILAGRDRSARFARRYIYFSYLILFFAFFPNCGAWSQAIRLRLTSKLEK